MGGSSKAVTVGYKYYLGMHMILCHGPIDSVKKILVDNKTAWSGTQGDGSITISARDLFGGEKREGGVSGTVDVQLGTESQMPNSYLLAQLGSMTPGFRGVVGIILRQCYIGMNPYIKRWAVRAQRIHIRQNGIAQWYDAKSAIGNDMNPAHIIRECLTDPNWGLGYNDADIDDASFIAAADTLYNETMGISLLWDKSKNLSDFIQDILQHIQGSLYVSRSTGKFVLKLTRADYVIGNLLVLDEDSINKITDFKRSAIGELINSVTVIYWDSDTGKDGSVTVQDIALVSQQQAVVSTTKQYPGFTNGANAVRAASTELKALSTPLASGTVYANRKAASLNVGDCFVLSWPRYGISQLVCRVTNVELGSVDSNMVKLSVIEDVFAQSSAVYAAPPVTGWTNPNNAPAPCPNHVLINAPYWELVQRMGETDAASIPATSSFIVVTGTRPTSDARNAEIYTNPNSTGYTEAGTVDFCPFASLAADVTHTTAAFAISGGVDLEVVTVGSYALIDDEIVSITAISDTSVSVGRGCLDTVPAIHTANTKIYFADLMFGSDNIEYANGETVRIKLLPITGQGTLPVSSAVEQTVVAASRHNKPYPPQRLSLNGFLYADAVRGDADISLTWAHRDRLQQTAALVDYTANSIGPEASTTYSYQILTEGGAVITSATNISGTSAAITIASLGSNFGRIRVKLWSVRSGTASTYSHDYKFTRAGYGSAYGYSYGGA